MRRVPDAGLSNVSLAFLLQVRDAAELHGRVTSYNFSHFTSYGLARPPAHSPQHQTPLKLPNAHLWKEIQIALSPISLCYFHLFGYVLLPQSSILVVVLTPQLLSSRICFIYPSNQRHLTTPQNKLCLSWNSYARPAYSFQTVDSHMALVDEARNLLLIASYLGR